MFSKSLILVKNPLSSDSGAAFIEDINDTLLGSGKILQRNVNSESFLAALNGYVTIFSTSK